MNNIDDLLKFDPLAEAEKLTGKSYKTDSGTEALGFLMHIQHNERKNAALEVMQDTSFSRDMEWMRGFMEREGFELAHKHDFVYVDKYFNEGPRNECVEYYWHPEGILFILESYNETRMNTCKGLFNWKPNEGNDRWPRGVSGGFEDDVFCGDKDGREGFRHFLTTMRATGSFVPKWHKVPFLWLLSYADSKVEGYDHKAITAERLTHFPQHVKDAMGV